MCKQVYKSLVANIAKEMVVQLEANQHKGDRENWARVPPLELCQEIVYHTGKLETAIREKNNALIKEYAADVANLAAMVLDACGLTEKMPPIVRSPFKDFGHS